LVHKGIGHEEVVLEVIKILKHTTKKNPTSKQSSHQQKISLYKKNPLL
jgi:hypothetical protein